MSQGGGVTSTPSQQDLTWSQTVANQYELDELDAMNTWMDVNLDLNQQRLESITNRLCTVLALAAANIALVASAVDADGWPFTAITSILSAAAIYIAATGLTVVVKPDRDPASTWSTMWGTRKKGELQVILYRRRSVLFEDQRKVIDSRAASLKHSSFTLAFAVALGAVAILISQLV